MPAQKVDLYQPIMADKAGVPPLALRVGVINGTSTADGVQFGGNVRAETYVLLSALPEELRRRVELAVQMLIAGR
jgi:hypothetical protein